LWWQQKPGTEKLIIVPQSWVTRNHNSNDHQSVTDKRALRFDPIELCGDIYVGLFGCFIEMGNKYALVVEQNGDLWQAAAAAVATASIQTTIGNL